MDYLLVKQSSKESKGIMSNYKKKFSYMWYVEEGKRTSTMNTYIRFIYQVDLTQSCQLDSLRK